MVALNYPCLEKGQFWIHTYEVHAFYMYQKLKCLKLLSKNRELVLKSEENIFLASFSSVLPSRRQVISSTKIKTEASSPLKSRWFFKWILNSDYKSIIDKVFHSTILFMGPGFLKFSLKWNVGYVGNKCCHTFGKKYLQWNKISLHFARLARLKMMNFTIWSKIIQLSKG